MCLETRHMFLCKFVVYKLVNVLCVFLTICKDKNVLCLVFGNHVMKCIPAFSLQNVNNVKNFYPLYIKNLLLKVLHGTIKAHNEPIFKNEGSALNFFSILSATWRILSYISCLHIFLYLHLGCISHDA